MSNSPFMRYGILYYLVIMTASCVIFFETSLLFLFESVESKFAEILLLARFFFFFAAFLRFFLGNSRASRDTGANLRELFLLILTALARGLFEFVQLSLAIGAQSGQARLFGVATSLETSFPLVLSRFAGVEQGVFAIADLLFLVASFQCLVLLLVVPTAPVTFLSAFAFPFAFAFLFGFSVVGHESGHGLLDASYEIVLQRLANGLLAFLGLRLIAWFLFAALSFAGAVAVFLSAALSTLALAAFGTVALATFAFFGFSRWSTAVVGVASVDFGFQGFPFGFSFLFSFLMARLEALVEILELSHAVLSQCRSGDASDEQRDDDGSLHDQR